MESGTRGTLSRPTETWRPNVEFLAMEGYAGGAPSGSKDCAANVGLFSGLIVNTPEEAGTVGAAQDTAFSASIAFTLFVSGKVPLKIFCNSVMVYEGEPPKTAE